MTQFKKYTSGVYCIETEKKGLKHGENLTVTTRYGKAVEVTIWKHLFTGRDGFEYYSYIREDGFNRKEWQAKKLERNNNAAAKQKALSNAAYEKSNKDREFLSLGEPIKVGHHSERKHRAAFENARNQMRKCVEHAEKAETILERAATIEMRLKHEINIDTPACIEQLNERIEDLEEKKALIKARPHQKFELTNLGANIRRYKERLETAIKLWDI